MLYYSGCNAVEKPNAESINSNYAEREHLLNLFLTDCKDTAIFRCFGFTNYVTIFTFCTKMRLSESHNDCINCRV